MFLVLALIRLDMYIPEVPNAFFVAKRAQPLVRDALATLARFGLEAWGRKGSETRKRGRNGPDVYASSRQVNDGYERLDGASCSYYLQHEEEKQLYVEKVDFVSVIHDVYMSS